MLKFSRLEPNKVYRVTDKFTLPVKGEKAIGKENLITVFGENISDTINFFSRNYIRFRSYRKYFIERYMIFQLLGKKIYITNNQKEIYNTGFGEKYPSVMLSLNPGNTSDYNTVYEIGQYMETIFNDERLLRKPVLARAPIINQLIIERLKKISKDFPLQKNKYFYLPLDNYIPIPKDTTLWTKRATWENHMVSFIRNIETNWRIFKDELPDWTFVFMNINELFYIRCKDMNEETFTNIKALFRKFRSKRGLIVEEQSSPELETVETESTEELIDGDETDESIKETNKAIVNKAIGKVEEELKDVKISEEKKKEVKAKITDTIIDKSNEDITKIHVATKTVEETKNINKIANNKTISQTSIEKKAETELKKEIMSTIIPNASPQRLARIKKLQEDMGKITIENKTLEQIKKEANSKIIEDHPIKADVINEKMTNIKFDNFEKGYNDKLQEPDLVNILTCFANMDRPLYLIKLDKEDTSTTMDKKYTYTAVYEDEKGRRHTLKFDYPKFVNNKFIHINHSDKLFINQIIPLPVTKVSPDEVQVSSNYKKIFMTRFGKNVSVKSVKINKVLPDIDPRIISIVNGNNTKLNAPYLTTIEYDDLAEKYSIIRFNQQKITIYFNQQEIREICENEKIPYADIPFAIDESGNKKKVISLNSDTRKIDGLNIGPIDYIIEKITEVIPDFESDFNKVSGGKRLMYTRAKIMNKQVPIVLLLSFLIGLEPLLHKLNIDYTISEKRIRTNSNQITIEFNDCFLIYTATKFSNSLILNGLADIPTKEHNFLEFSNKDVYYDLFNILYGRRNIGVAFENFNQAFIDPITKEVLEDYNMPTNFIDLLIYANSLLENNTCDFDGDLNNFRIRSNELVNAHLYQLLATAYESYRATADNKNPQKFSIKQNALINSIFDSQILEEYSTLNPIFEIDRMRATSYKGLGGCNLDRAFKLEKRAYNDTMLGVLAQSSPVSANIGISRVLSLNPNITSLRGYIQTGDKSKMDNLDETNMMSGAELLVPLTATHDDPQRVAMASTQSRHTIATVHSDVPLFGYGYDKVLAKTLSNRFVYKAKNDGVISEIDDKLGYMIIKYKDGESEVVDLTNKQALNTGSGFYINNKLSACHKVGDKIKEGDIVACNEDFFQYNELTGDAIYKSGPLARVAVIHGSPVFEDSTIMTAEFAEKMGSMITHDKVVLLGKNSNIYHMAKIGDEIKVNDPLLVFDESYEDEYLNKILEKMTENEKTDILESGRTNIPSKWNGKVIAIEIYYTIPKEELSESLKKIINDYERDIKKRLNIFKQNGVKLENMTSLNEINTFTVPVNGKIKGQKMNDKEVFIQFYVQTLDKFSGGDKCTYSTALKGIDQTLIPEGKEPYLASDPSIKVDAFMSMSGYYARMTNSFPITMALNTVMIGAEKKIKDILDGKIKK